MLRPVREKWSSQIVLPRTRNAGPEPSSGRGQLVERLAPLSLCCGDGWKTDCRFGRLTQLAIHGIGRASLVRKLSSDRGLAGQLWRAPRHVPRKLHPRPNNPPLDAWICIFALAFVAFPREQISI
jgi:hypothetical protein